MDEKEIKELVDIMSRLMQQTINAIGGTVLQPLDPDVEKHIYGTDGVWQVPGKIVWHGDDNRVSDNYE